MKTVYDYLQETGSLPKLGDPDPPWRFKGWALPYVQQIHAALARADRFVDRWGYLLATIDAGKLLDDPIPRIKINSTGDAAITKSIDEWTRLVGWDMGGWSDFRRLIDWLAWALGVAMKDESNLEDDRQEKLYRAVNLGPMIERPHDYFGQWICERKAAGWNPTAFYPTPHSLVELMTAMTFGDVAGEDGFDESIEKSGAGRFMTSGGGVLVDSRTQTVCDPCVGTGRMLLHASNYSLCLYGQDIDPLVCAITRIHGALWAPWMVFPLPESIVGSRCPPAPPAPLPVPEASKPDAGETAYRIDGQGQGWLF